MKNNEYTLEKCSLYDVKFIKDIPIVLFKEHNMALLVWGTYSSRLGSLLNLVTFDFHTDTHNAFNSYLMDKDISIEYGESVLQKPVVKKLLEWCKFKREEFCFEDVFKLSHEYIKNSEQILTAYSMEYIESYTVVHRDDAYGYEEDDRLCGFNAKYINALDFTINDLNNISTPIALDFDLDYFRNKNDLDDCFFQKVESLIKKASVITIAREPKYFGYCKTDVDFSVCQAEEMLLSSIRKVLND